MVIFQIIKTMKTHKQDTSTVFKQDEQLMDLFYFSYWLEDCSELHILFNKQSAWLTVEQIAQLYEVTPGDILQQLQILDKRLKFKPDEETKEIKCTDLNDPDKKEVCIKFYSADLLLFLDKVYKTQKGWDMCRWSLDVRVAYMKGYGSDEWDICELQTGQTMLTYRINALEKKLKALLDATPS